MGILSLVLFAGAGFVVPNYPQLLLRVAGFSFDWGRRVCNSRPKKLGIRQGILSLALFAGAGSAAKNNPQLLMPGAGFSFD